MWLPTGLLGAPLNYWQKCGCCLKKWSGRNRTNRTGGYSPELHMQRSGLSDPALKVLPVIMYSRRFYTHLWQPSLFWDAGTVATYTQWDLCWHLRCWFQYVGNRMVECLVLRFQHPEGCQVLPWRVRGHPCMPKYNNSEFRWSYCAHLWTIQGCLTYTCTPQLIAMPTSTVLHFHMLLCTHRPYIITLKLQVCMCAASFPGSPPTQWRWTVR